MTHKLTHPRFWTPEQDARLTELFPLLFASEIAHALKKSVRSVQHRARKLGLVRTPEDVGALASSHWDADLELKLGEPVGDWLRRKYVDEEWSMAMIESELHINRRPLMRLMRENGIDVRTSSEAFEVSRKRNPHFLDAFLASSSKPDGPRKRALGRQVHWESIISPMERALLQAFNKAGLMPVPQLAVETFNIDFAFPDEMMAVELDPRWHHSPTKRPADARKDAALIARGWSVLRLDARSSHETNIRKVSDALKARASTHPR